MDWTDTVSGGSIVGRLQGCAVVTLWVQCWDVARLCCSDGVGPVLGRCKAVL